MSILAVACPELAMLPQETGAPFHPDGFAPPVCLLGACSHALVQMGALAGVGFSNTKAKFGPNLAGLLLGAAGHHPPMLDLLHPG